MQQIISHQIDSINIDTYNSIEEFVENTTIRTVKYERMIFVSNVIPKTFNKQQKEQQLYALLEYISRRMPEMRIVTMCRDEADYSMYKSVFNVPIYANADVSKGLNANLIMSAIESELPTLKVQLEGNEGSVVNTISQTVEHKVEDSKSVVNDTKQGKKEKGGIFSKLFGGRKKKGNPEKPEELNNSGDTGESSGDMDNSEEYANSSFDDTKFELPKFDNDEEMDVPIVQAVKEVDDREKFDIIGDNIDIADEVNQKEIKELESIGVKYDGKKRELVVEDDEDDSVAWFGVENKAGNKADNKASNEAGVVINPLTGKPIYRGAVQRQEGQERQERQTVSNTTYNEPVSKATVSDINENIAGVRNISSASSKVTDIDALIPDIPKPRKGASVVLPDLKFDTKQESNVVVDDGAGNGTKSGVTVVGATTVDEDGDDLELFSSSSKRRRMESANANVDDVKFDTNVKNPDVVIDDDDIVKESGVTVIGEREKKEIDDVALPIVEGQKKQSNTTDISGINFNVGISGPNYNVDTSENEVKQSGVQRVGSDNIADDDDDFEASFVGTDYRRRSNLHGDIGLLTTFGDVDNYDISRSTSNASDIEDDEDLDINVDPAYMQPVSGAQPKVIEKVVERVVEKPVEVIKEVEKIVEKPVETIVEKEVIKEKTVYVSGGSAQAHSFKQIMSKKEPVYLLVTGDRRSGITTAALSLANIFGSQIKTLYVDLDTENHGSIIRLGVMDIIEEPDSIQEGLKNLRNTKGLKHIVYWGNNKFASLISNFDVDITDEEITRATNALAVQQDFDLVVIDCPFSKIGLLDDILPLCDTIICMDGSAQSVINTMGLLADLKEKGVSNKMQNMMFRSARLLITEHGIKLKEVKENMQFVDDIFNLTDDPIPWINTPVMGSMDNFAKAVKNM